MIKRRDFIYFKNKLFSLYFNKKFEDALKLAEFAYIKLPDNKADTLYWKACLYSLLNRQKESISCLNEAITHNIWWSPKILTNERDFDKLRNLPEFNNILNKMDTYYKKANLNSKPKSIKQINNNKNKSFIVNLHWKDDNIYNYSKNFGNFYKKIKQNIIFIQSSQVSSSKGFCWDVVDKGINDVENILLNEEIEVSKFSGTSQGAVIALLLAIKNKKPFYGFMPAITNFEELNLSHLPYWQVLIGENDPFFFYNHKLFEKFTENCRNFIVVKKCGHYFSKNFLNLLYKFFI